MAEDSEVNRLLVEALLRRRRWQVICVAGGREAVEEVRRSRFEAVLLDVQMPGMDGLETARAIRALEGDTAATPLIGLAANARAGDRERCLEAGMDDCLAKPVEPELLCAVLERLTGVAGAGSWEAPVDLTPLLQGTGGGLALVRRLAARFAQDWPHLLRVLEEAVAAGDPRGVEFAAHKLRGGVSLFGARRAVALAERLEDLGRGGDLAGAGPTSRALAAELARVGEALSRL